MDSAELQVQEEARLALVQSQLRRDARVDAAAAYAALAEKRALLNAAEARYDDGNDIDGLDEALRVFSAIGATAGWAAWSSDRRADLGCRASRIYRKRYENTGDENDLQAAISTAETALVAAVAARAELGDLERATVAVKDLLASGPAREQLEAAWPHIEATLPDSYAEAGAQVASLEPAVLAALGEHLIAAFDRHAQREQIDRAVDTLKQAAGLHENGHPPGASKIALHLGAAHLLRYKSYGDPADAAASVAANRDAVDSTGDALERAAALDGLGCALLARSETSEGDDDLTEAVECHETAVTLLPDYPWYRANLASALSARFARHGEHEDRARAGDLITAALAEVPAGAPDRARLHQNALAITRTLVGSGGIAAAQALLDITPPGARTRPARMGGLAAAILQDAEKTLMVEQLDESVRIFQEAVESSASGAVDRPSLLHGLGQSLATRFAVLGRDEDLTAALAALRDAVAAAGRGGPELPNFTLTLALAASMQAARSSSAQDQRDASALFLAACESGQELNTSAALRAGEAWIQWAAEEGNWADAAKAGTLAVAAADRIYRVQVGRSDRETSLAATGRLHGNAAMALLKVNQSGEALITLERGRAQLVSDALDGDRAKLRAARPELARAYASASMQALRAQGARTGMSLGEAHEALDRVIAEIRELPGYGGFLAHMDVRRVAELAEETAIVYVASNMLGTAIVAALPGGQLLTTVVDGVDDYVAAERYERLAAAQRSRHVDPRSWREELDDTGLWLGRTVWSTIRDVLGTATSAVLIPSGFLTLLPLQIAWCEDDRVTFGRRYAIDEVTLSFAPNARALESCRRSAAVRGAVSVLTVGAPEHTAMSPLKHASAESAAVRELFDAGEALPGADADRLRVLDAISRHSVLHFACHGRARPDEPLQSALLLAGDDVLTVQDVLDRDLPVARLAVLSACETSAVGTALVDEVLSLPTGFVQAGVPGVIATSWEVDDDSAALMVRRFFDEWAGGSPGAALRSAQQWVRQSNNGEKLAAYPDLAQHPPADLDAEELEDWRAAEDHADIHHWGGFIHVGA